jgi:hypothetical protein
VAVEVVDIKTKAALFHPEVLVVAAMGAQVRLLLRQAGQILVAVEVAVRHNRSVGLLAAQA